MEIIDLAPEHEGLYFVCLEDWSDEAKESGPRKGQWYAKMKGKGLRVKLARDDDGQIAGMVQYLPVEHSFIEGQDLYFIHCLWVHGYKQGRGDRRGRGIGKALLAAAEADARALGAKGIAAWGISLPFWMRASWFKKQGFRRADNNGGSILMWKPFAPEAVPPRWIRERRRPTPTPGKVTVTSFVNGWCLAQPGREYVVFQNKAQPLTLEITGAKSPLKAEWFNPHTGKRADAGSFGNGTANLMPPIDWGGAPLVLHLRVQ